MKIGFTGSRDGMTDAQLQTLRNIIGSYWIKELVVMHGCCVGADAQFHALCKELGARTVGHPAFEEGHKWRGVNDAECDEMRPIEKALVRNGHIVDETNYLIAAPKENKDEQRSGAWATIRLSRKAKTPRAVIYPDGSVDSERKGATIARDGLDAGTRYGGV